MTGDPSPAPDPAPEATGPTRPRWLNRTVLGAGLTSALGDLSYETVTVVLPGFLAALGIPAAALGAIEGFADALKSIAKTFAGHLADRLGHRKALVVTGYALTPIGQALIALALAWPLILAGRALSWIGKGLRGPLRDAIVIQSVTPATRGRAFGFHRALDTLGAVAGPLLGVWLLGWAGGLDGALPGPLADDPAGAFRLVLWLSLVPGVLAVLAFLVLVEDPGHAPNPALRLFRSLAGLPGRVRRYLAAVGLFGLGDYSHALLILAATTLLAPTRGMVEAAQVAGLLYVLRNVVQVIASWPVGWLADRIGHRPVLVAGYALGAGTALLAMLAFIDGMGHLPLLAALFALAGLYTAVQEALESTVAADAIPSEVLATGLGALGTVNGIAKFASSAGVGLLWTAVSPVAAFALAALLMAAGTVALARLR
jgi:MFS family permease